MDPILRTTDRVLIDINERQLSRVNGVHGVDHLGTYGIKRVRAVPRTELMVMSDNKDVAEPFEIDAKDARTEDKAIWFARDL